MSVPAELKYTAEHEWLDVDGDTATVGSTVAAGRPCGEIESTKSVSELYAPVDGEVVEVNAKVAADPGLLNTDPFGEGWLIRMKVAAVGDLLDAAAYLARTGGA
ncbi:glycine cleavage system protein H [Amycolatopsis thermophila]|uniref:Glycine cleavage system H protein n=1 Tax=Amycolatopsis thermophila TaxID=206084 RepID=A0ABU0EM49_9PSEU|nr:biotin/lipoyl-containing protein [Amycolatopsis thermophila]MDQ0376366.1 glycine cleavage system H protein [Amycolatopsis thermophila]